MAFLKAEIEDKLGTVIQGVLTAEKLTTSGYLDIIRAKLRGILRAAVKPVSLSAICKDY
jgi:uncharacterized protein YfkK (UPF0435 family)